VVGCTELLEALGAHGDLLFALAPGCPKRGLAMVDNTGRELVEDPADSGSVLAHEIDVANAIEGDHRYGIRRLDDIACGRVAVGQPDQNLLCRQVASRIHDSSFEDFFSESHRSLLSLEDSPIVSTPSVSDYPVPPGEG
jgi:hypothetical protein